MTGILFIPRWVRGHSRWSWPFHTLGFFPSVRVVLSVPFIPLSSFLPTGILFLPRSFLPRSSLDTRITRPWMFQSGASSTGIPRWLMSRWVGCWVTIGLWIWWSEWPVRGRVACWWAWLSVARRTVITTRSITGSPIRAWSVPGESRSIYLSGCDLNDWIVWR